MADDRTDARGDRRPEPWWVLGLAGVVLAGFTALRFWTTSDLWLDEAQTVAIAHLPLAAIPEALRQDGSPPLYYFLLHFWMEAFGTGDLAVRSLSGLFGVAGLPLAWMVGRSLGGRPAAWAALLVMGTSPFAVRYSTEARMYTLVILLSLVGYLALRSAIDRPTVPRLGAVAAASGLLLLTHYWDLYLAAAVAAGLVWRAVRGADASTRSAARWTLVAWAGGAVLLAPWAPSFIYQLTHTGTPWAGRADLTDFGVVFTDLGGMGSRPGDILATLYVGLIVLGLFGAASGSWHVDLDLRGRPTSRPLGWVALVTVATALAASEIGDSTFQARYLAVVFVPVLGLVALGVAAVGDARTRVGILLSLTALGALASYPNVTTNRTQAGKAAADIVRYGHPGDVVAYCPDQLGPAMVRLLPATGFHQVPYPRRGNPALVDWADYAKVNRSSHPLPFARYLVNQAGPHHAVWLVWSPDYPTFQGKCNGVLNDLGRLRPGGQILFYEDPTHYFEHEELVVYRSH